MLHAGLADDPEKILEAAVDAGFVNPAAAVKYRDRIDSMIGIILSEMNAEIFDFGDRAFVSVLRDEGMAIAQDRSSWHLPPAETLFIQRKVSGTALLGARLKAKVDVRGIVSEILAANPAAKL